MNVRIEGVGTILLLGEGHVEGPTETIRNYHSEGLASLAVIAEGKTGRLERYG